MQAEYQNTILTPVFPNQGSARNREKHFDGTLIVLQTFRGRALIGIGATILWFFYGRVGKLCPIQLSFAIPNRQISRR
jgi:hypothetical protein